MFSNFFSKPPGRIFRLKMVRIQRGGDDMEDNKEVGESPPLEGTYFWEGDPWAPVGGNTQILQSHVDPENIILSSSSQSAEEHQIWDVLPDPFVQRVPNSTPVDLVQGFRALRDEVAKGFR